MTAGAGEGGPRPDPSRPEPRVTVRLTHEALDVGEACDAVADPAVGGIGVFLGVVRDHHGGEAVVGLDYEAWEQRARTAMRAVAQEVLARFPDVRAVYVAHRLGALAVGEAAVVVAASAPHRQQAIAAAQALIDRTKQRVPIWKRERLANGTVRWPGVDGPA